MNLSVSHLIMSRGCYSSPIFSGNVRFSLVESGFNNFFHSIAYLHHCTNLIRKCRFSLFLNRVILMEKQNFHKLAINQRILLVEQTSIQECTFKGITNSEIGACFNIDISGVAIELKKCRFYSCKSSSSCGAFFVGSLCTKLDFHQCCFTNCEASSTHNCIVSCPSEIMFLMSFMCANTINGQYGTIYVKHKPTLISDINSTKNLILHHGSGLWIENSNGVYVSRVINFGCVSKGVLVMLNSPNSVIEYLSMINNTCTLDGILWLDGAVTYKKSTFFNNTSAFLNSPSLATFSDCTFDYSSLSGPNFIGVNLFSKKQVLSIEYPGESMCNDPHTAWKSIYTSSYISLFMIRVILQ